MKRLSALLAALMLCLSLFAASVKPSMDGRAVVADIGELPIGLFAKSAAFLPGDTVVVTNPATHISIEVMIFGGFDASEGIAIVLSPEAARELYINKGSNVIVQVTKKTDAWSENTILSKTVESYIPDDDPDVNQEMMIDDIEEPVFDTPGVMVEDVVFYVEEPILPPEEFVDADDAEAAAADEAAVEELLASIEADEAGVTEEAAVETTEGDEVPAEDSGEAVAEEAEEETPEVTEEPVETGRAPLITRGNWADAVTEESADDAEEPMVEENDEKWALIPADAEFVDDMDSEETVAEEVETSDEEVPAEDIEVEAVELETVAEVVEEPVAEPVEATEEVEENVEGDDSEDYIVETEVILIPTEFFPPVSEAEPVEEEEIEEVEEIEEELEDEESGMEDETDRVIILDYDEDVVEEEPALPAITVVAQSDLPKGYYVQILTASKMTTVEDAQELYGAHYPMQFAESSRGGIQVLIGPLTADEYAIIQTRFRSYGYKDCFVRNIK